MIMMARVSFVHEKLGPAVVLYWLMPDVLVPTLIVCYSQSGDMEASVTLAAVALTDARPEARDNAYRSASSASNHPLACGLVV